MEDFLERLLDKIQQMGDVESASRIDGENAIGVETIGGEEYFVTVEMA